MNVLLRSKVKEPKGLQKRQAAAMRTTVLRRGLFMKESAFEYTMIPHGDDGQMVRGVLVKCRGCPIVAPLRVNYMQGFTASDGEIDYQFIRRRMEAKGWEISRKRDDHLCPACSTKRNPPAKSASGHTNGKETHHMKQPPPIKTLQDAAIRSMGREDRRIIFEKLNEVYLNEKVGYSGDWSDERVARDLNVPQAWVRLIREENLGEAAGNEATSQTTADVQAFMVSYSKIAPELQRLLSLADKIEKNQAELLRKR